MEDILQRICRAVWGPGLLALLLGTGALCTLRLRFVQLRFFRGMKLKSSGGLSQAGTVCLSLGAAMGTGNITGVAAALAAGGPGAIFWMWVSAFLGMALVYAENELSVRYSDSRRKGPMAYLEKGLGSRTLAGIFAVFCMAAAFGMGGMVQVSSFAETLALPGLSGRFLLAGAVFGVVFFVISGGAKRSGKLRSCFSRLLRRYTSLSAESSFSGRGNGFPAHSAAFFPALPDCGRSPAERWAARFPLG